MYQTVSKEKRRDILGLCKNTRFVYLFAYQIEYLVCDEAIRDIKVDNLWCSVGSFGLNNLDYNHTQYKFEDKLQETQWIRM